MRVCAGGRQAECGTVRARLVSPGQSSSLRERRGEPSPPIAPSPRRAPGTWRPQLAGERAQRSPLARRAVPVRRSAVTPRVLGPGVEAPVEVVVAEIPGSAGLDLLTAASTPDSTAENGRFDSRRSLLCRATRYSRARIFLRRFAYAAENGNHSQSARIRMDPSFGEGGTENGG